VTSLLGPPRNINDDPMAPSGPITSAGAYLYAGLGVDASRLGRFAKADGTWTVVAGSGGLGTRDEAGSKAWFWTVRGIASDGTGLWVDDAYRVLKLTPTSPLPATQQPRFSQSLS
jgi:hypothetical protein